MAEGENEGGKEGEGVSEADSSPPHHQVVVTCKEECIDDSSQHDNTNGYDSSDGNIPLHRCDRCDYEAMSHASLLAHVALCPTVRTTKMFECDVCQMKFSNSANMRRHKMRHTGVKPYECRICGKRFFRKDHLQEHLATHTKSNPFKCPICTRGFQRQIAMRAHFQNEHVQQGDAPIKTCPLCDFTAASMKNLRIHFYNRHGIDLDQPGGSGLDSKPQSDGGSPPMHFLAPQVEISHPQSPPSPRMVIDDDLGDNAIESPGGSPESGDSSSQAPTSSSQPTTQTSTVDRSLQTPSSTDRGLIHLKTLLLSSQTCPYCGITFPDSTLYFLHKGCHSEASPWRCNICGDQTANVYDFNSHLLSKNHQ